MPPIPLPVGQKYIPSVTLSSNENYEKRYKHKIMFDDKEVSTRINNWLKNGSLGKWGWHYERKKLERGIAPKDTIVVSFKKREDAVICILLL
tara:strand:- start:314 stop:589 length:276 start_codon:yes stop_codon:yes gene_type:complete